MAELEFRSSSFHFEMNILADHSLLFFFFERLQVTSQPRTAYRSDPKASQCQILRVVGELPFYYVKVFVTCPVLKAAMYTFLVSSGNRFHKPLAEFQKHEQLQCSFFFPCLSHFAFVHLLSDVRSHHFYICIAPLFFPPQKFSVAHFRPSSTGQFLSVVQVQLCRGKCT